MLTLEDIDLMLDALARAASRHESLANRRPGTFAAHQHDETAAKQRALRFKLLRVKKGNEQCHATPV